MLEPLDARLKGYWSSDWLIFSFVFFLEKKITPSHSLKCQETYWELLTDSALLHILYYSL